MHGQVAVGGIGESLSDDVRAIACKEGRYRLPGFSVRAFDVFKVCGLIAVSAVVDIGCIGTETAMEDVKVDTLRQYAVAADGGSVGCAAKRTCRLVSDDIDDTGDGVRTVERRGGTVKYLDAFDAAHVDAVQVDIVRDVARELLPIDKDEDVFVAKTVQTQESAHGVRSHRDLRHHAGQGSVEGGDALFLNLLCRKHMDGRGSRFQALVMAGTCDYHRIEVVGATDGRRVTALHFVDLGK